MHETYVDDHRGQRCPTQLQVVPASVWPAPDPPRTSRLRSASRLGRNGVALPPPVGHRSSSFVDESRRWDSGQWTPVVLPRRRFRQHTATSTRSCPALRGRPAREPKYSDHGVLTARSGRILRHGQCTVWASGNCEREEEVRQALTADQGAPRKRGLAE